MKDVLDAVLTWRTLVGALVIFGFAPGAALRLIVLAFRKGDPRRAELRGELPAVPRWERPFWVAQQLECALFEGVGPRIARRVTRGAGWLRAQIPIVLTVGAASVMVSAGVLAAIADGGWQSVWTNINVGVITLIAAVRALNKLRRERRQLYDGYFEDQGEFAQTLLGAVVLIIAGGIAVVYGISLHASIITCIIVFVVQFMGMGLALGSIVEIVEQRRQEPEPIE